MKKVKGLILLAIAVVVCCCLTGCFDFGGNGGDGDYTHTHNYTMTGTVEPTCSHEGYDVYMCTCGNEIKRNIVDALPHSFSDDTKTVAPTCEERGYTKKTCTKCGYEEKYDFVDATGHNAEVIKGYEPTCETSGLTDSEKCTVCKKVLTEQTTIPALGHNQVVTKEAVAATCTSEGLSEQIECSRCGAVISPQTGTPIMHTDADKDSFCDVCHILLGDDIIDISTAQLLKNIVFNLGGKYRLTADITVSNWTPIGTAETPFTGKFDGGGHTVSGLKCSGNLGGLFGYNKGNIENLNIDGWSFEFSRSRSEWNYASLNDKNYGKEEIFAGAVCAVNDGSVKNCTVKGNSTISCSTSFILGVKNPFPTGSAYYEFCVGGLVGKNNNTLDKCSFNGNGNMSFANTAEYYVDRGFFTGMAFGAGYKVFRNSMTMHFGWLTGYNIGTVSDGIVEANCGYRVEVKAHQDGFGHTIAQNVIDLGSAIGLNSGTAKVASAPAVSVSPSQNLTATPPWSGKVGEYCQSYNELTLNTGSATNGVVGRNA